jgi:hypothetical protein
VQTTFTWLDWRIIDKIISAERFDINNIDEEQALQLCFNIFPRGMTILHKLAIGDVKSAAGDQIQAVISVDNFFTICSQPHKVGLIGAPEEGSSLEIPILENWYGLTAIDYCLG